MSRIHRNAFTLVEILIVVVILGILSAIVVPQFAKATEDAQSVATLDQLTKIRQAIAVYHVRNNAAFPDITAGVASWGALVGNGYMKIAPTNNWVSGPHNRDIVMGNAADTGFHQNYGWIFNPATGDVWAAGFDDHDRAFPKP